MSWIFIGRQIMNLWQNYIMSMIIPPVRQLLKYRTQKDLCFGLSLTHEEKS